MRRMKAAFASLSAPRLLLDQLAVSNIVHIFVPSNFKMVLFVAGPPTTDGTGQGKCTMRYDGTEAACSIECNAP